MKKKKNRLFIQCDEAQHVCDKSQYSEASFFEKIKLSIHLLYCNACRKYTARNQKLTSLIKNPEVQQIKTEEKNAMKELLKQNMEQ